MRHHPYGGPVTPQLRCPTHRRASAGAGTPSSTLQPTYRADSRASEQAPLHPISPLSPCPTGLSSRRLGRQAQSDGELIQGETGLRTAWEAR